MRLRKGPKSKVPMSLRAEVGFTLRCYYKATPLTLLVILRGLKLQWGWRPRCGRDTLSQGCVTVLFSDTMKAEGKCGGIEVLREVERYVGGGGQEGKGRLQRWGVVG